MISSRSLLGIGVTVVVGLALGYSAYLTLSSPYSAREVKLDDRRVNDLQQLQSSIDNFYQIQKPPKLPSSLAELTSQPEWNYLSINAQDPDTKEPYAYRKVSDKQYEVCANFATDAIYTNRGMSRPLYPSEVKSVQPYPIFWHHSGNQCFTFTATEPVIPQPIKL